jgi:hypothetical protein
LYPAEIVTERSTYRRLLDESWNRTHNESGQLRERPEWTYFTLAEAHQWLYLGAPERAAADLEWFWANQASPGLFSWWEGKGEENTFHRWEKVWGWFKPAHVTPHYWAAAEMLMLQLDMLVLLDETGPMPRLIIGRGIPGGWMEHALRVDGLSTRLGEVGWQWRNGRVTVRWNGPDIPVELGPAFPSGAELRIRR